MSYLIGGSGSSGTTFLKTILDNHPEIFSGAELALFNKERLYRDWNKWKTRLVSSRFPFSTDGWFPYASHNLWHESYGWEQGEIASLIEGSHSLMEFVEIFFSRPLKKNNKTIWVEKTPSNTYGFQDFLKLSGDHKVIHMVRNPYDTVASLIKRGMSPVFAAGVWVYNNSAGFSASTMSSQRFFLLRYEDLVESFESSSLSIISFLGASRVESVQFGAENKNQPSGIQSWNNSPSGPVSKTSVGSFAKLDLETQEIIKQALHFFRVRDAVANRKKLVVSSAVQLCDIYDYEYLLPQSARPTRHVRDLIIDFSRRSLHGYSTGWLKYPGKLVF